MLPRRADRYCRLHCRRAAPTLRRLVLVHETRPGVARTPRAELEQFQCMRHNPRIFCSSDSAAPFHTSTLRTSRFSNPPHRPETDEVMMTKRRRGSPSSRSWPSTCRPLRPVAPASRMRSPCRASRHGNEREEHEQDQAGPPGHESSHCQLPPGFRRRPRRQFTGARGKPVNRQVTRPSRGDAP